MALTNIQRDAIRTKMTHTYDIFVLFWETTLHVVVFEHVKHNQSFHFIGISRMIGIYVRQMLPISQNFPQNG